MHIQITGPDHTYQLSDDGTVLSLIRQGRNGYFLVRLLVTMVLTVFAGMPLVALYIFSDYNPLAPLIAIPIFTVMPWYPGLAGFAYVVGLATGSWGEIHIDSAGQKIRARRDGHFLWGNKRVKIDFSQLREIQVERRRPSNRKQDRTRIKLKHTQSGWFGSDQEDTWLAFRTPEDLQSQKHFFAFVSQLAGQIGWSGHQVKRNDHLQTTIQLVEDPQSTPGAPISDLTAGPRPQSSKEDASSPEHPDSADKSSSVDAKQETAPVPDYDLPPLEPEELDSSYQAPVWEPGSRVRVKKEGYSVGETLVASIGGTLLGNLPVLIIGWVIFVGPAPNTWWPWKVFVGGMFLFITLFYNLYIWTEGRTHREAEIDWTEGTCRFRKNKQREELPIEDIQGFWVQGVRRTGRGEDSQTRYWCRVFLDTKDSFALMAKTDSSTSPDPPYKTGARMAQDLAEATNTDWEWRGWQEHSVTRKMETLLKRWVKRYS